MTKRLLITASLDSSQSPQVLLVNTDIVTEIESQLGKFGIRVFIRNFDGSSSHKSNSLYNLGDDKYLNNEKFVTNSLTDIELQPNLRLVIDFTPRLKIKGTKLVFGNTLEVPIRDYVPMTLISAGLKVFNWCVNSALKADIYADRPYIYGFALNGFSRINAQSIHSQELNKNVDDSSENLGTLHNDQIKIPEKSEQRKDFFNVFEHCDKFLFDPAYKYRFTFETNLLYMGDSRYSVCLPSVMGRTFNLDVTKYSNESLNNFNWIVGLNPEVEDQGLRLNFALVNEEDQ